MNKLKQLSQFAKTRRGIISLVAVLILLGTVAFIGTQGTNSLYTIQESKITISGKGGSEWVLEANGFPYQGEFIVNNGELQSIENVSFEVPVSWLRSDDMQMEEVLKDLLMENNSNILTYKQRHGMVLPIMQMIHLVGEFSMTNRPQAMAFQANYTQVSKDELHFESKQEINLSDFGIQIPADKQTLIQDKVEVKIEIKLVENTIL